MEIRIKNITKSLKGIELISDVSFVAYPKEVVGVLAPHGSGKSLLLDLIRGAIKPDKGNISFVDNGGLFFPHQVLKKIGYLSAENPLYEEMTVLDFLLFIASLYGMPRYLRKDRVRNLVKMCGLVSSRYKKIKELSLGYRQKVGLAQALVHNPDILLLDEPVKRLDPVQSKEIYDLIKALGKEQTIILSSSRMRDMENMCDTMLVLSRGRILAKGTVEALQELVADSRILKVGIGGVDLDVAKKGLLSLSDLQLISQGKDGVFSVHVPNEVLFAQALFQLCNENGWYITCLMTAERSLEDIFKQLQRN